MDEEIPYVGNHLVTSQLASTGLYDEGAFNQPSKVGL